MIDVPLLPLRLLTYLIGDDGLYHMLLAYPNRSALYAVCVPRCRGLASGFTPTSLHSDAVASSSGLASPPPLEDFHLQSITHDGCTTEYLVTASCRDEVHHDYVIGNHATEITSVAWLQRDLQTTKHLPKDPGLLPGLYGKQL